MPLEISLRSLSLNEPFRTGTTTLVAELVWPRGAIRSRSGVRAVELRRGKASFSRRPYYERLLLKEKVDGRFGLTVGVTRPGNGGQVATFLAEVLGTMVSAVGSGLGSSLELPATALRRVVREPFNQVADLIEDDDLALIAGGGVDLSSEEELEGRHVFPLRATRTLRDTVGSARGPRARPRKPGAVSTVRKGTVIGEAVLDLRTNE